jgi:hypothetical protein
MSRLFTCQPPLDVVLLTPLNLPALLLIAMKGIRLEAAVVFGYLLRLLRLELKWGSLLQSEGALVIE